MKMIFFEVDDLEKKILKQKFPKAVFTKDKLDINNVLSCKDSEIVSCRIYSSIDKKVIDKLLNLKLVVSRSTGYDNIDVNYCKNRNISVTTVPGYGNITVAEHTWALLLNLTRNISQSADLLKKGSFKQAQIEGMDLYGKTIGIIGLGRIGAHVLKIAQGFGMKALAFDFFKNQDLMKQFDFKYVNLETLIKNSDVITLHLSLSADTYHIINKKNILDFKKGSYLINTARGGLIDTEAIILGLNKKILSGAGLDVLENEDEFKSKPNTKSKITLLNNKLITHSKVIITPHNAFNSQEALNKKSQMTVENIENFIK